MWQSNIGGSRRKTGGSFFIAIHNFDKLELQNFIRIRFL